MNKPKEYVKQTEVTGTELQVDFNMILDGIEEDTVRSHAICGAVVGMLERFSCEYIDQIYDIETYRYKDNFYERFTLKEIINELNTAIEKLVS